MPVGKNKGGKHEVTDPRKKIDSTADKDKRGQQLSDKQAKLVASGKKTYEQGRATDSIADSKVRKIKTVSKKVRGSSQGLASKTKGTKANFRLNNQGNMEAY